MKFLPTPLAGAFIVQPDRFADSRGAFMQMFCARTLSEAGLMRGIANVNFSHSVHKHTLRGMHYQLPPNAQAKVVGSMRGEAQDIIVDLRPHSPTFKRHFDMPLRPQGDLLFVPKGFAHGFLSLSDDFEIFYLTDDFYAPNAERGIRYDDPEFNLPWQAAPVVMSEKDKNWRDFSPDWHLQGMDSLPAPAGGQ